jgi:hypothetical protein
MANGTSDKSNTSALLLCFFLGIWALIDMITIILQKFTDGQGDTLKFN